MKKTAKRSRQWEVFAGRRKKNKKGDWEEPTHFWFVRSFSEAEDASNWCQSNASERYVFSLVPIIRGI